MDEKEETTRSIIIDFIQHNPRHFIELNLAGKKIRPCARCFGLWIGLITAFFLSIPFIVGLYVLDNFLLIFLISWGLVIPAIIDWSTVKLGLRKGNNNIRVTTGFCQGLGIIIYLFILPAGIIFKLLTYGLYEGIFYLIRWKYHISHYSIKK